MPSASAPSISIVIPTYNGADRLPELLKALDAQRRAGDEVLIVDDCSPRPPAPAAIPSWAILIKCEKNKGVGAARNLGAKEAKCEIIAFFDDDVVPRPDYLDRLRATMRDPDVMCCQGPHHLDPAGTEAGFWGRVEAAIWHHQALHTMVRNGRCLTLYSGAFAIRKDFLLQLGGFDETFGGAGGEEFALAMRILEKAQMVLVPDMQSHHRYKTLTHRLRTLRIRAQNYPGLSRAKRLLPPEVAFNEKIRLLATAMLIGSLIFSSLWPPALTFTFISAAIFLAAEGFLLTNLVKWRRSALIFPVIAFRFLTYATIATGAAEGILKLAFKRSAPIK